MKKIIMVLTIVFCAPIWAESLSPTIIKIKQNDQVSIDLSSTDINKIFVAGEKITAITKPDGLFNSNNDDAGNIYGTVTSASPFTAFISTDLGFHFSVLITPKSEPGQTIEFEPKGFTQQSKKSEKVVHYSRVAEAFEQSSDYEKTLVSLIKSVMMHQTPPGYTAISKSAFSQVEALTVSDEVREGSHLHQVIKAGFLGGGLAVRVLEVKNESHDAVTLFPNEFYSKGIRAVSISKELMNPGEKTFVFEVVSNA